MFISTQKLFLTIFKSGKGDSFISRIYDHGVSEGKYSVMTSRGKPSPDLVKGVGGDEGNFSREGNIKLSDKCLDAVEGLHSSSDREVRKKKLL